jgi:hypothetical protein
MIIPGFEHELYCKNTFLPVNIGELLWREGGKAQACQLQVSFFDCRNYNLWEYTVQ